MALAVSLGFRPTKSYEPADIPDSASPALACDLVGLNQDPYSYTSDDYRSSHAYDPSKHSLEALQYLRNNAQGHAASDVWSLCMWCSSPKPQYFSTSFENLYLNQFRLFEHTPRNHSNQIETSRARDRERQGVFMVKHPQAAVLNFEKQQCHMVLNLVEAIEEYDTS